jgi:hypothetical protein
MGLHKNCYKLRRIEIRRYNIYHAYCTLILNRTGRIFQYNVLIINVLRDIRRINPPLQKAEKYSQRSIEKLIHEEIHEQFRVFHARRVGVTT